MILVVLWSGVKLKLNAVKMAAVRNSLVILLVKTLVCIVKSDASVTTPIMGSVNLTRNASSEGSDRLPVGNLANPEPSISVCLLNQEGADILNITLECRPVPSYQNISWSIKRANSTSWENLGDISDERFEASSKQLRILRVTHQDDGLVVECLSTCTRFNDAYTVTYDGQSMSYETCPLLAITGGKETDINQNLNITCFTDPPRQLHPLAFIWIAIGVFVLCVCLLGVLCYTITKRPRGEQDDTGGEPTAATSSDAPDQANRRDMLGIIYSTPREICSSNTLSRIQTFLSTKRAASTSIGNTSTAEAIDATPAAMDQTDKPEVSKARTKLRSIKSHVSRHAGTSSDDAQTHRDIRNSSTLSRIQTLLSTKKAASTPIGNTSTAEGIDSTPVALNQPDKPETSTARTKGLKTRVKTISGEGWLDERPYVNV